MTPESLVRGSAAYHIQYEDSSTQTRSSSPSSASESIPLVEALHDHTVWEASRDMLHRDRDEGAHNHSAAGESEVARSAASIRRYPRTARPRSPSRRHVVEREFTNTQNASNLDNCDWPPLESVNTNGLTRAPTPPPFTVIAESDDGSDDVSSGTGPLPPFIARDDGSDEYRDTILELHYGIPRPARRRTSPGRIEPRSNPGTEGGSEGAGTDILQPSANFFMGEQRSRITIKFEPPV